MVDLHPSGAVVALQGAHVSSPAADASAIRDAIPRDSFNVCQVLAAACATSLVGRWIDPFADSQGRVLMNYVSTLTSNALSSGIVRVVEDRGEIVGVALWTLHPREEPALESCEAGVLFDGDSGLAVRDRRAVLMSAAERHRPRHAAHHQLVYLGVRPGRQRRGIGTRLLISHHALLHVTGTPSYVLADDIRTRDVFLRHGYSGIGPGRMLPGGLPVWPMWRPAGPAVPH